MTTELFLTHAIRPAMQLLPAPMDRIEAHAMLLAIALQESKLLHRRQMAGGPARSYLQFERAGIAGVLRHNASARHAHAVCEQLDVPAHVEAVYEAITYHDVLACCFGRLLLWTSPRRLPGRGERDEAWREYVQQWRPGMPRPEDWPASFARAWVATLDTTKELS